MPFYFRLLPSTGRSSGVEPDHALEVVDQVGYADLCFGPFDADGADEQAHDVFHSRKGMLYQSADLGAFAIGP